MGKRMHEVVAWQPGGGCPHRPAGLTKAERVGMKGIVEGLNVQLCSNG